MHATHVAEVLHVNCEQSVAKQHSWATYSVSVRRSPNISGHGPRAEPICTVRGCATVGACSCPTNRQDAHPFVRTWLRLSLALGPTVSARNALQAKWRRFWGAMPGNPKPEPAMPEPYNRERVWAQSLNAQNRKHLQTLELFRTPPQHHSQKCVCVCVWGGGLRAPRWWRQGLPEQKTSLDLQLAEELCDLHGGRNNARPVDRGKQNEVLRRGMHAAKRRFLGQERNWTTKTNLDCQLVPGHVYT